MKWRLTTTHVLALHEPLKSLLAYNGVYKLMLGCVLIWEGRVVTYVSQQLKDHEKNYLTHNLELVTIVFDLKIGWHYLYGKACEIYIGCKSLNHLFTQKNLNMRQKVVKVD